MTVSLAISSHEVIGPSFFNWTVNCQQYLHMLHIDFAPQSVATQLPISTKWFMQDGATPHTADTVLNFLRTNFGPCAMSHRYPEHHSCGHFWPPHSPDFNPYLFFWWAILKGKVFPMKEHSVMEVRAVIIELCNETDENVSLRRHKYTFSTSKFDR